MKQDIAKPTLNVVYKDVKILKFSSKRLFWEKVMQSYISVTTSIIVTVQLALIIRGLGIFGFTIWMTSENSSSEALFWLDWNLNEFGICQFDAFFVGMLPPRITRKTCTNHVYSHFISINNTYAYQVTHQCAFYHIMNTFNIYFLFIEDRVSIIKRRLSTSLSSCWNFMTTVKKIEEFELRYHDKGEFLLLATDHYRKSV